jgi:hypothetical protein
MKSSHRLATLLFQQLHLVARSLCLRFRAAALEATADTVLDQGPQLLAGVVESVEDMESLLDLFLRSAPLEEQSLSPSAWVAPVGLPRLLGQRLLAIIQAQSLETPHLAAHSSTTELLQTLPQHDMNTRRLFILVQS